MMRLIIYIVWVVCMVSCRRDHLHYATQDEIVVRLNIDWSHSGYTPNGVTLYVYSSDGKRYGNSYLSSNTEQINMRLPADSYTFVVHNNSRSEFRNVEFVNSERLSTFMVRSRSFDHPYYEPYCGAFVALEPEVVLAGVLRDVRVEGDRARYHYFKPNLEDYTSSEVVEVEIVPDYIVHLAEVQVHLDNVQSAVDVPIAILHGMSRGYFFGAECTSSEHVVEQFPIDITGGGDDGVMEFSTFGIPSEEVAEDETRSSFDHVHHNDFEIEMLFVMASGEARRNCIAIDKEDIEIIPNSNNTSRTKYIIKIEDQDILEWEVDEDFDYDDSDMDDLKDDTTEPSVDDWVDVVVPLPL